MAQDTPQPTERRLTTAYPSVPERKHLADLRTAGVKRDTTLAPLLLEEVRRAEDFTHYYTALHALARIGGPEALLAAEEAATQLTRQPEARDYALAVRARLLAHNAAESLRIATPQQRAARSVNTLLQTMGYSVAFFNAAVAQEQEEFRKTLHPRNGRATFVLRELADMVYQERNLTLLTVAQKAGINFDLDQGVKYKAQLAALTAQQRVDWIIQELPTRGVITLDENFLIQLAGDEGKIASRAAAKKLREMDQHREQYVKKLTFNGETRSYYPSLVVLFEVIEAVGDSEQEPMMAKYMEDPETYIRSYAQEMYVNIREGAAKQRKISY